VALPAFAAERPRVAVRRAAAAPGGRRYRSTSLAQRTHSSKPSKPAARCCCCRSMGQTDGQTDRGTDGRTDGRKDARFIDHAAHTMRTVPIASVCEPTHMSIKQMDLEAPDVPGHGRGRGCTGRPSRHVPTASTRSTAEKCSPTYSIPQFQCNHSPDTVHQGCSGAGTRGTAYPTFFDRGDASPTFWTEIRAKLSPPLQLVTY